MIEYLVISKEWIEPQALDLCNIAHSEDNSGHYYLEPRLSYVGTLSHHSKNFSDKYVGGHQESCRGINDVSRIKFAKGYPATIFGVQ